MCAPVTCKKPHLNMYQTALDAQKQTLNNDIVFMTEKNAGSQIWQDGKKDIIIIIIIINVHEVQMFT